MKKLTVVVISIVMTALLCLVTACGNEQKGKFTIEDIEIEYGEECIIKPVFENEADEKEIVYTFDGNNISITDGTVKGLAGKSETVVTAKTEDYTTTFTVKVKEINYGELQILDMEVSQYSTMAINPVFTKTYAESEIIYTFDGNNISIENGMVKGLNANTETAVTATAEHNRTTFKVKVKPQTSSLTNPDGSESKFVVNLPETDDFIVTTDVEAEKYIEDYTRLCSFAFNGSNNSWYNIEYMNGKAYLFARFNGVEKYWIELFGSSDENVVKDGKFAYTITILKKGQATYFFFNDKYVCSFSEKEMDGYGKLGGFEITAAADRTAGEYKINITVNAENDQSPNYKLFDDKKDKNVFDTFTLSHETGAEQKFIFGDYASIYGDYVLTTTIDVETYSKDWTRLCAFAFNGSDNSWYNVEMGADGNVTLYAKFNGIEKYFIHLFNINDDGVTVDGKIHFTVALIKKGQSTHFFVNGLLKCTFSDAEMNGYAALSSLEVTASADRSGGAYSITFSDAKISTIESDIYKQLVKEIKYADIKFVQQQGAESKYGFGDLNDLYSSYLITAQIKVNAYSTDWTRLCALAFNGSDNSWYNIEIDGSGNATLFAKFNGVEKYFIHVFNIADEGITVGGKICFDIALLKQGQATTFFVNGKMVCGFTESELNGYAKLTGAEITASADRNAGAYDIEINNAVVYEGGSEIFNEYVLKTLKEYQTTTLTNENGDETKMVIGDMSTFYADYVFTCKIEVSEYVNDWTRLCAFAFNGSDNSWYNIEMGADGNATLYARFNGVEKYGISLFNKDNMMQNGKIVFDVTLLKAGQKTYFFINDELKASFSDEEMNGYGTLTTLEITAAANRVAGKYSVNVVGAEVLPSSAETFKNYLAKVNQ